MTQRSSPIETSLLYPTKSPPIDQIDVDALRSLFTMLGFEAVDIRQHNQDYIFVDCDPIEVVIVACTERFPADHFDGADMPGEKTPAGLRLRKGLGLYGSSLTVIVVDKETNPGHIPDPDLNRKIGWQLMYLLMQATQPDLVFWCEDDRMMTPEMASAAVKRFHLENAIEIAAPVASHGASKRDAAHSIDIDAEKLAKSLLPTPMTEPFAQQPVLSSDALEWLHRPKAKGEGADAHDHSAIAAANPLPGLGNWLRRMSHVSRATVATSLMTITIGLFGLPYKASAALGKLF